MIVEQYMRTRATEQAKELLRHQLYRVYDALREAQEKLSANDVAVIGQFAKLSSLLGNAQSLARIWVAFEEAEKAAQTVAAPEAPLTSTPEAEATAS